MFTASVEQTRPKNIDPSTSPMKTGAPMEVTNLHISRSTHDKAVGGRNIDTQGRLRSAHRRPRHDQRPPKTLRDLPLLQAVTTKATLSGILRMISDSGGKTHLRAVTIKAALSCILCIRIKFGASPGTLPSMPQDPKAPQAPLPVTCARHQSYAPKHPPKTKLTNRPGPAKCAERLNQALVAWAR